jgi:hypothetical protein
MPCSIPPRIGTGESLGPLRRASLCAIAVRSIRWRQTRQQRRTDGPVGTHEVRSRHPNARTPAGRGHIHLPRRNRPGNTYRRKYGRPEVPHAAPPGQQFGHPEVLHTPPPGSHQIGATIWSAGGPPYSSTDVPRRGDAVRALGGCRDFTPRCAASDASGRAGRSRPPGAGRRRQGCTSDRGSASDSGEA